MTSLVARGVARRVLNVNSTWHDLKVPATELRCDVTLTNGQCFAWTPLSPAMWLGCIGKEVFVLKQTPQSTYFQTFSSQNTSIDNSRQRLKDYFHMNVSLQDLSKQWCKADSHIAQLYPYFRGLRLLRQPPLECLLSFICSSNNNIKRIVKMLDVLRLRYGCYLGSYGDHDVYSFPLVTELSKATEQDLRDLGFGYRAKFIVGAIQLLETSLESSAAGFACAKTAVAHDDDDAADSGSAQTTTQLSSEDIDKHLRSWRTQSYQDVHKALLTIPGVGPKVADCVALFSLDQFTAVPVDTHVWQIATRDYSDYFEEELKGKSITKRVYGAVGDVFRTMYGRYAGWAHSVLFAADLSQFRERLPPSLQPVASPKRSKTKAKKRKSGKQGLLAAVGQTGTAGDHPKRPKRVAQTIDSVVGANARATANTTPAQPVRAPRTRFKKKKKKSS